MKLRYKSNYKELADDELMHYKYIKREQVNGKWRYYYNDTSRVNNTPSNRIAQAKKNMERAAKKVEDLKAEAERIKGYIEALNNTLNVYLSKATAKNDMQQSIDDVIESIQGYTEKYNEVMSQVGQAERDYEKAQKIYVDTCSKTVSAGMSISSKTVSAGMAAVKVLSKLGATVASLSKKKGR